MVAVVDAHEPTAREIAGLYGARAETDFRRVLDDVDALNIATPTIYHHKVAMACLEAGKDLLIEKPITVTVAEADEIVAAADKSGAVVQVGHIERYNPAVVALMDMVKDPRFIEMERITQFRGRGTDVHITLDLMIHDVDIAFALVGRRPMVDVRAVGACVRTALYDAVKAWVGFEGGVTALMTASRMTMGDMRRMLKVHQPDGFIELDYLNRRIRRFAWDGQTMNVETVDVEQREPLRDELEDFLRRVHDRARPRVSASDGRDALAAILHITESIGKAG